MKTLAVIPARSGSKGIPHKNIATFHGKPLIAHSIRQAIEAESVSRVIVSTDSELYAEIARSFGAETPFLRPMEISEDQSTDLEAFTHALTWLKEHDNYVPDICVHLRPTYPTRRVEDIDRAVDLLQQSPETDSVRTVVESPETPFKMWRLSDDGMLRPAMDPGDLIEPWNQARQSLPTVYLQSANIDVVWTRVITEQQSMTGTRIRALLTQDFNDIDAPNQLAQAASASRVELTGKTFVFDIDGVIATLTPANNYELAEPLVNTIGLINKLYDAGNRIILFTARGTMTGIDWSQVTRDQMNRWGVRFHDLQFGKPAGDYYVDDRFIALDDLTRLATSLNTDEG